jgi:hypothetical protein
MLKTVMLSFCFVSFLQSSNSVQEPTKNDDRDFQSDVEDAKNKVDKVKVIMKDDQRRLFYGKRRIIELKHEALNEVEVMIDRAYTMPFSKRDIESIVDDLRFARNSLITRETCQFIELLEGAMLCAKKLLVMSTCNFNDIEKKEYGWMKVIMYNVEKAGEIVSKVRCSDICSAYKDKVDDLIIAVQNVMSKFDALIQEQLLEHLLNLQINFYTLNLYFAHDVLSMDVTVTPTTPNV